MQQTLAQLIGPLVSRRPSYHRAGREGGCDEWKVDEQQVHLQQSPRFWGVHQVRGSAAKAHDQVRDTECKLDGV
eukprot:4304131-Prymnesium_polylepis.1